MSIPIDNPTPISIPPPSPSPSPSSYDPKYNKFSVQLPFKLGRLNLYGAYYGSMSLLLGSIWFTALSSLFLFYKLTLNKIDKNRRMVVFCNHVWGVLLLRTTFCYPRIENLSKLQSVHSSSVASLFVANHASWMDIPYMGAAIGYGHFGWRNYKIIAKKELEKVPILGFSIVLARHVIIDRTSRRSQLQTLKSGIKCLEDGVHLCAFPEGTRSRTGRLMPFKRGAFKMAAKAKASIVPLSIVGSELVMPTGWIMPMRPSRNVAKVIIHDPISSTGLDEKELNSKVVEAIASGLPPKQQPA